MKNICDIQLYTIVISYVQKKFKYSYQHRIDTGTSEVEHDGHESPVFFYVWWNFIKTFPVFLFGEVVIIEWQFYQTPAKNRDTLMFYFSCPFFIDYN